MLYFDRVDIRKGIDPAKSCSSKKWMVFTIGFLTLG